ncbi:MAG: hypothetical protein J5845_07535 [Lachnospiraceae bacterium]|nr:hypothetical protein [Lachnospiraceae bacterium]
MSKNGKKSSSEKVQDTEKQVKESAETKIERLRKPLFIAAVALVAVAIGVYFLVKVVINNPNRSAADAAEKTIQASDDIIFDDFVKSTIYNDKCSKAMKLDVFDDLEAIEKAFGDWKASEAGNYKAKYGKTAVTEYASDTDMYKDVMEDILEMHAGCDITVVEKVAIAKIPYTYSYDDGFPDDTGTETYVVLKVKGRWYCHPGLEAPEE